MALADLTDEERFFLKLADAVAGATLPLFRTTMAVENKLAADFDPVTEADKGAERAIRALIESEYPEDGILGEEYGLTRGDAPRRWVIDPIDGTRAFICGLPVWGSLIGVIENGRAVSGAMIQPFTGEVYLATGGGTWLHHRGVRQRLATSGCQTLADARAFTTSPHLYPPSLKPRFEALQDAVRLMRYGCDCYAFAMLAAGHADLVIEPGLKPYDIAGLIAPIEQAGGVVTTLTGERPEEGGDILAAATPQLHAEALSLLSAV